MPNITSRELERIYKTESGRVLACLVRLLGNLDLAEEALQIAFNVALEKWPEEGIPKNPVSWLISTGKFKAIDSLRRSKRGRELLEENFSHDEETSSEALPQENHLIEDDQLRLIFLCCHPLLPLDSRIALSLRDICGMRTEEIASAYLTSPDTVKKRISRAKSLFRERKIPYELPSSSEMSERLNAVLHVIYLIFNEGYSASSGEERLRKELTEEAVYLCRTVVKLAATPESMGLLALLLLQEARRESRTTESGDLVPLEEQDRSLWNRELIREGEELIQRSVMSGTLGPYTLQAAIASVHVSAGSLKETRWDLILGYYDMLLAITPSPVVELNRAIAVGMQEGSEAGLALITALLEEGKLVSYHLLHAARADFLVKLGRVNEAIAAYDIATTLVQQEPERRYLQKQRLKISS